jgi:hypothetical protein
MTFQFSKTLSLIFSFIFISFLNSNVAWAQCSQGQAFTCFDQEDADKVFKDLTSAFAPTTVSGAGSLGKIFGVELGLIVSASRAPNTQEVIDSYGSDFEIPGIPMAGISAIFTLPYGIGVEGTFIPKIDLAGQGSFESLNLGARWTITDLFPMGLLKVAIKSSLMTSNASFTQTEDTGSPISGTVTETADFDVKIFEVGAVMGLNFKILEPYIGASDLSSNGTIKATGTSTGTLIIPDVNENSEAFGLRVYGGVLIKLPLMRIGAEVGKFQDIERASIKFAFKF